jgi:hypothetical protein
LPRSSATMLAVIAAIFLLRNQFKEGDGTKKKGQKSPFLCGLERSG